jgi:Uma2 family endonuclease
MTAQDLFQHLKESPDAVLIIDEFQKYLKTEAQKRQEFYDLVHEDIKAEFINGEIVLHSPVARKHWLINSRVSKQLMN